ncbi:MAG: pyridoxamine 5'-phosphate oxidase family protein [Acidimicrobiales bacterium]
MTTIHPIYRTHHGLTDSALEVLTLGQHAILGTENPDGSVHVTPTMYLFDEGRIYIETAVATRKARNVGARPRATVLVQDLRANGEAWVSGTGPAEILHGDHAQHLGRRIRGRYLTETGEVQLGTVMAIYDDVVVAVNPDRWMAWDMTAFNTTLAEHGLSLDHAQAWFRS